MGTMPVGTVTLLFSDIEGSTSMLRRLGAAYAGALDAHRRVLRAAWAAHDGTEMGTQGDSFFVAFRTASDALSAAVEAQRHLAELTVTGGEEIRVRMGIHTGTPTAHEGDYVGMDVHRCARIGGVSHGGQIVLSDATVHLLGDTPLGGVTFRDLGFHRLKDLPVPEHLYQVQAEGLRQHFPPLRSLGAASRLPTPETRLVGREAELAELAALLAPGAVRLVTLSGAGGSGKTRLALELARGFVDAFPDGVHFIPLAEAKAPNQMWDAIAGALSVPPGSRQVLAGLAHVRALLVLDNLEQVARADDVVARILRDSERVSVVVTSRRPLHLPQEHEYPVAPLGMPSEETVQAAQASPAVQLFVQHARRVRPDFDLNEANASDVVAVCRALDGLPLALEIAGARVKVLSPHALVVRLGTALDMQTMVRDVATRQRTLRATIAWSYELLPVPRQAAFVRLGVFDGGADLAAVSAILAGTTPSGPDALGGDVLDVVTDLVDASLAMVTENYDGEPRVTLLETVRAFAVDQLAAHGALDAVRHAHARHYLGVAETRSRELDGGRFWQAREALDAERNNFREALRWCLETPRGTGDRTGRVSLALRLASRLCDYWETDSNYVEARQWLEPVVAQAGQIRSTELGECLLSLARSLGMLGDTEGARRRAQEAVELFHELGDRGLLAQALLPLAVATLRRGDTKAARSFWEEAVEIAREPGDKQHNVIDSFALFEFIEGHHDRALALHEEAIALAQQTGDLAAARLYRLNRAFELIRTSSVREAQAEFLALAPGVLADMIPMQVVALAEGYATILPELGQHREAVQLLGAADALRERQGYLRHQWLQAEVETAYAASKKHLRTQDWNDAYQAGRHANLKALLGAQGRGDDSQPNSD